MSSDGDTKIADSEHQLCAQIRRKGSRLVLRFLASNAQSGQNAAAAAAIQDLTTLNSDDTLPDFKDLASAVLKAPKLNKSNALTSNAPKRKRGRPPGSGKQQIESRSKIVTQSDAEGCVPQKKVGRPHKDGEPKTKKLKTAAIIQPEEKTVVSDKPEEASEPPPIAFLAYIDVCPPPRVIKKGKTTQNIEQEPVAKGPIKFDSETSWRELLRKVAGAASSLPHLLQLESMTWRWLKPANSSKLPLSSEVALKGLYQMAEGRKGPRSDAFIKILMATPLVDNSHLYGNSSETNIYTQPPGAIVVADERSDDAPVLVKLDDRLAGVTAKLKAHWKPGSCPTHPTIYCAYIPGGLHFELTDARMLAWANKIQRLEASVEKIPLGSAKFKSGDSINHRHSTKASSIVTQTPIGLAGPGLGHHTPMTPVEPLSHSLLSAFSMLVSANHNQAHPDPVPSSPPLPPMSLAEFCTEFSLSPEEHQGLERMRFRVGDKPEKIKSETWTSAGFVGAMQMHVEDADRRLRRRVAKGRTQYS
ncbi:hypothetical protein FRC03_002112 [Tulasnella sp. 419]|nr:hypothetical protein FRC03_002112 [Tulasnella sp. 419]